MSKRLRVDDDDGAARDASRRLRRRVVEDHISQLPSELRGVIGTKLALRSLMRFGIVSRLTVLERNELLRAAYMRDILPNLDTSKYENLTADEKTSVRLKLLEEPMGERVLGKGNVSRHSELTDWISYNTNVVEAIADAHDLQTLPGIREHTYYFHIYRAIMEEIADQVTRSHADFVRDLMETMGVVDNADIDRPVVAVYAKPNRRRLLFEFHYFAEPQPHGDPSFKAVARDTDDQENTAVRRFVDKFNDDVRVAVRVPYNYEPGNGVLGQIFKDSFLIYRPLIDLFLNCLYDISPLTTVAFPTLANPHYSPYDPYGYEEAFHAGEVSLRTNGTFQRTDEEAPAD